MTRRLPDPVVTANVYCEGLSDDVIHGALAPFQRALAAAGDDDSVAGTRLWFLRYPKRGEHLKIRLHAPHEAAPRLREMLADAVETCFAALPPGQGTGERKDGKDVPPIDAEDAEPGLAEDRSLLWTTYRRSHISLGGPPLLDDDGYVDHITTCLARGSEILFASLKPNAEGKFVHTQRQTILLRLVTGGLGALGFGAEKSATYLAYHRDWLLRFTASRSNAGSEKIRQTLAQFEQRAEQMGAAIEPLRILASLAFGDEVRDSLDGTDTAWWEAMRSFQSYLDPFRGNPDYQLDPFATDIVFSPVFKVFHGCANQLGLNMLNESFAHHLLGRALAA